MAWNFQDIDNGHKNFPNQSELGWESVSCKKNFFSPNQSHTCFGKSYAFLGCNFSNQTGFGVEKDAEQNVAAKAVKVLQCLDKR